MGRDFYFGGKEMQKNKLVRVLALLLALVMVVSTLASPAFAVEGYEEPEAITNHSVLDLVVENWSRTTPLHWRQLITLRTAGYDLNEFAVPTIANRTAEVGAINLHAYGEDILSLIAMGQDPRNHHGRDLVDEVITWINANPEPDNMFFCDSMPFFPGPFLNIRAFFAINAANAMDEISTEVITNLLSLQSASGAFDMWGFDWPSDEDTAVMIIALQPFAEVDARVAPAMERAISSLREAQDPEGGGFWSAWGPGNPGGETTSHAMQAITATGQCVLDWYVNNDFSASPAHAMLNFVSETGVISDMIVDQAWFGLASIGLETCIITNLRNPIEWPVVVLVDAVSADFADLDTAIEAAGALTQSDWTPQSWQALQTALTAANTVRTGLNATQARIDTATTNLQAAITALVAVSGGGGNGGGGGTVPQTVSISVTDPGRQAPLFSGTLTINTGETAYSILRRTGLTVSSRDMAIGMYVYSIAGIAEFSGGAGSGWVFRVNGEFPGGAADSISLSAGDTVEWLFTRDLGQDVGGGGGGGGMFAPPQTPPQQPGAPEDFPFTDIAVNAWYRDYVNFVWEEGLMNGVSDTLFAPSESVSRAMVVTVLHRLAGEPVVQFAPVFSDVAAGQWYTNAVIWAASEGIVQGVGDGRFAPQQNISREEMAVMLFRYADASPLEGTPNFTDLAQISPWALAAMQWANESEFIRGLADGSVNPQGTAIRAEHAAVMTRFVQANS